jgi:hypothetical protein
MLKTIGLMLAFIFTIVASDYIGRNGWSPYLGIPLAFLLGTMVVLLIGEFIRGGRR